MPGTIYERDPVSGTMVMVLGAGMDRSVADGKYVLASGDTMTGALTVTDKGTYPSMSAYQEVVSRDYVDGTNVGMVCPFTSGNIPSGWIYCNGQAVSRTTYSRLYNVIGTNYGAGDGSSTFNVPNFVGRCWVGCGSSGYFDGMGEAQGVQSVQLSGGQVPYESGQWEMHDAGSRTMIYFTGGSITNNLTPGNYRTGYTNNGGSSIGGTNINLGFGGGYHNNIMWTFVVHYIIKY